MPESTDKLLKDHKKWFKETINNRIDTCIQLAPSILHYDKINVFLYLPEYVIIGLFAEIPDIRKPMTYRGYQILPGYENRVVLAHKNSAERPDEKWTIMMDL